MVGVRRTNQGGSIATFVVVGLVLTVVLFGGIYLLNQRGQQARNTQDIATSETTKTKKPTASTDKSDSSSAQTKSDDNTNENTTVDVVEQASDLTSSGGVEAEVLPETGGQLDVSQLIGVFVMTAAIIAYFMSIRVPGRSL